MNSTPTSAFVLGAGLGTRLRPLTNHLPKPMIRVFQKPLITFAFDHLNAVGVRNLIVNTHHLPDAYDEEFPYGIYGGVPVTFRHEPVLLETGGGIKNIQDLIAPDEPLIVYNGDILTDMPIATLVDAHAATGADVTIALRSNQGPLRVVFDEATNRINGFGAGTTGPGEPNRLFSGVYVLGSAVFDYIEAGAVESIIPAFERMISDGRLVGGVTINEGAWFDLGSREALLRAHTTLLNADSFPRYAKNGSALSGWKTRLHRSALVQDSAIIDGTSVLGENVEIGAGATVRESIIYAGARVADGVTLERCVVSPGATVEISASDVLL
jgi:NDP-sugar pyrophosphorylase family protein